MNNIFLPPSAAIYEKEFKDGLSRYTQSHCQVTLTDDGYRIYRDSNLTQANDGSVMWGGLKIVNMTTDGIHAYNASTDNSFNLSQGHTYIICFHVKGQSSTKFNNYGWSNNMGWSGGGVTPSPSDITFANIPDNFQGEQECWYKFTINDAIKKTCTSAYSSYVVNTEYLSYRHFAMGWGYSATGALGTDLYITNLRMYDITTGDKINITKSGILYSTAPIEVNNQASFLGASNEVLGGQFYEY